MDKVVLPIDKKSLFLNIFNDNGKLMNEKEYISTFFEKKP